MTERDEHEPILRANCDFRTSLACCPTGMEEGRRGRCRVAAASAFRFSGLCDYVSISSSLYLNLYILLSLHDEMIYVVFIADSLRRG